MYAIHASVSNVLNNVICIKEFWQNVKKVFEENCRLTYFP